MAQEERHDGTLPASYNIVQSANIRLLIDEARESVLSALSGDQFYRQTGKQRMMDYHGFWQGFISLFGVLSVVVGAIVGMLWAWRNGRRGAKLIPPAFLGGAALGLFVFFGAVLFFRA